jgi:serine/threonine-protein kinase
MTDELKVGKVILKLWQGDIVQSKVEAIVNAANSALSGGAGVDGAIHRVAGPELYELTKPFGGCPTGSAVITTAGRFPLPTRYIIHAVGPIYNPLKSSECKELLAATYRKSLELADEKQVKTIGFPAISTGVYGYPILKAAPIAINTVLEYVKAKGEETSLEEVVFVLFSQKDYEIYQNALPKPS